MVLVQRIASHLGSNVLQTRILGRILASQRQFRGEIPSAVRIQDPATQVIQTPGESRLQIYLVFYKRLSAGYSDRR